MRTHVVDCRVWKASLGKLTSLLEADGRRGRVAVEAAPLVGDADGHLQARGAGPRHGVAREVRPGGAAAAVGRQCCLQPPRHAHGVVGQRAARAGRGRPAEAERLPVPAVRLELQGG